MMPPVYQLLQADSAVTTLVGDRVYPFGEAPEGVIYPYATYGVITGTPENTFDKPPVVDRLGTQIDIWALTAKSCLDAAEAIRDALENSAHMISISNMDRDTETKSFRYRLEFDFFTNRFGA